MSDAAADGTTTETTYPAHVVSVMSPSRIVINRGTAHDVEVGDTFLVYEVTDEEIIDPVTRESLGKLEIPKGTGDVIHVQERMAIIESDRERPPDRKIIRRPSNLAAMMGQAEEEEYTVSGKREPFFRALVGDLVKPV
jgi:hypothetical protein